MSFFRVLIAATALLGFITPPATAAEIGPEGAEKLKTLFQSFMKFQTEQVEMSGAGTKLEYDGDIVVETADSYYAVTLPHARVTYPDGGKLDVGMISINASPHDGPGQWKMAIAVPTPIVLLDAAGKPKMKIGIGGQKAAGIWDESLENFVKLDAQYTDMVFETATNDFTMRLPMTKILYDFEKTPDGFWSGPGAMSATGLSAVLGPDKVNVKIAEIRADFAMDRYNPAPMKTYREKMMTLTAAMAPAPGSAAPPAVSPDMQTQIADMMIDLILNSFNSFRTDYEVSGIEISRANPQTGALETTKTGKGFFGMDMSGFNAGSVTMGLRFGFDGLALEPIPPGYDGTLPEAVNINLAFKNIPARQLADLGKNTLGAMQQPNMAPLAGVSLMTKTPALLSQAGTTMDVVNNFVTGKDFRFDVNGSAKADIAALLGFTGQFKGMFKGLDKLMARVQIVAADPAHPATAQAQELLGNLQMLKANGKAEPGPDGQVYTYDYKLTPEGQMLINGQPADMGAMMGGPMTMPPPTAPQPEPAQ